MSEMIAFEVHGEPVPMPRPRVTTYGGRAHGYTPRGPHIAAKEQIARAARYALGNREPLEGPVEVWLNVHLTPPKSIKQTKVLLASETVRPAKRPDLDNYVKLAVDALTGILWKDDGQVVAITAAKLYAWDHDPQWRIVVKSV